MSVLSGVLGATLPIGSGSGGSGASTTKSKLRQPCTNRNRNAYNNSTSSNRVENHVTRSRVALNANYPKTQATFANFIAGGNNEDLVVPDICVRYGVEKNGVITQYKFGGLTEVVMPAGAVELTDINTGIDVTAGDFVFHHVYRRYPLLYNTRTSPFVVGMVVTGGTSGATGTIVRMVNGVTGSLTLQSETGTFVNGEVLTGVLAGYTNGVAVADLTTVQKKIFTQSSHSQWREGSKSSNLSTDDFSNIIPTTNPTLTPTVTGGNISSVAGSGGTGHLLAPNLTAWEVVGGVLYTKTIGYCNIAAGAITSAAVTSGTPPAGLAAWVTPTVLPTGGSGFGTNSACWTPSNFTGIPSVAVRSLSFQGNSIDVGDGGGDDTGDMNGNHGFERFLNNRVGSVMMARPGASASFDAQFATIYPNFYRLYSGATTDIQFSFGSNDLANGGTEPQLRTDLATLRSYVLSFGQRTSLSNVIPRLTAWATPEAAQTAVAGFTTGGNSTTFNANVANGTVTRDDGYLDFNAFMRSVNDNVKVRVDLGQIYNADGIHPNNLGYSLAAQNSAIINFYNYLV